MSSNSDENDSIQSDVRATPEALRHFSAANRKRVNSAANSAIISSLNEAVCRTENHSLVESYAVNSTAWSAVSHTANLKELFESLLRKAKPDGSIDEEADALLDRADLSRKYHIDSQLGKGGNSYVYLGTRLSDSKCVVIKMMTMSVTFEHDELYTAIRRFFREAELISALKEEHIRQCLDYGIYSGVPTMILDYIDGLCLNELIQEKGRLSLDISANIITQVLKALDLSHRSGIIHRDIKPPNIMVSGVYPDYQVHVLDFGVATVLGIFNRDDNLVTKQGVTRGTPYYMAPELFTEMAHASIESDLYAVGLVYLEMLTGQIVFAGSSYLDIVNKQFHAEIEIPAYIPQGISDIILKMCAKSPDDRYHSARQAIDDIEAILPTAISEEHKCAKEYAKKPTNRVNSLHNNPVPSSGQLQLHTPRARLLISVFTLVLLILIAFAFAFHKIFTILDEQSATEAKLEAEHRVSAVQPLPVQPASANDSAAAIAAADQLLHVYRIHSVSMAAERVTFAWKFAELQNESKNSGIADNDLTAAAVRKSKTPSSQTRKSVKKNETESKSAAANQAVQRPADWAVQYQLP